jgi:hypothetical protein
MYGSGNICTRLEDYLLMVRRQNHIGNRSEQEMTMSGRTTSIAISAAIVLGIVGATTAALSNDSGENNMGGYVVPGSMAGVNPVYHPRWFGRAASAGPAGDAYGYAVAPIQTHRPVRARDRER